MPLGCDTYIIDAILKEVSKKSEIMIAPTTPFTLVRVLDYMPGSVNMDFSACKKYYKSIFNSFIDKGFRKIIIVSYHADTVNMVSTREAAYEILKVKKDTQFKRIKIWGLIEKAACKKKIIKEEDQIHAGESETSLMVYINSKLVKKNKIKDSKVQYDESSLLYPLGKPKSGVFGSPSLASKEKGKNLFKIGVEEILKILK